MAAVGQTEGRPAERTVFGHPVGLTNLFGVELWERFSFYWMLTRMSRVPWNFGGGPVSIRLRSPAHHA